MNNNTLDILSFTTPIWTKNPNATENETIYMVNPTDYYEKYVPEAKIVDRYVTPLTYVLGFPGNVFALYIWLQRRMLNSSGYYLAALALTDLIFLTLQVFHEINDNWDVRVLDVKFVCEFYPIIFLTSQFLSPLLVLSFTVERYISICHPFKREKFCTTKRARTVIVCLAVFCFCLNIIQGYFWSFDSKLGKCLPRPSAIEGDDKSLWSIWTWCSETLVFMLVPLLMLFFNVLVINEARRLSKFEKHQLKSHAKSHGNATTLMLLATSFYQICTTLPITIVVTLYVVYSPPIDTTVLVNSTMPYLPDNSTFNLINESALPEKWSSHFTYVLVKDIIEEIGLTHYAGKFYIYLITGKIFREEFVFFIQRVFCGAEKKSVASWNTEYTSVRTYVPGEHNNMTVRMVNGQANGHSANDKLVDNSETPL